MISRFLVPEQAVVTRRCEVRDQCLPATVRDRKIIRMAARDVQAKSVYRRKRDAIQAHPATVFAALAVSG